MWYRLLSPPPRSTPDPFPGQAFMPLFNFTIPFSLRGKAGVRSFSISNLDDTSKSPLRGETLALQQGHLDASPLSYQERGWGEVASPEQRPTFSAL